MNCNIDLCYDCHMVNMANVTQVACVVRRVVYEELVAPNRSSFWDDMAGSCAISSYVLQQVLAAEGIVAELVANNKHCWLEVDGHIVDITCTQFSDDAPEVFVASRDKEVDFFDYYAPWRDYCPRAMKTVVRKGPLRGKEAMDEIYAHWPYDQAPLGTRSRAVVWDIDGLIVSCIASLKAQAA